MKSLIIEFLILFLLIDFSGLMGKAESDEDVGYGSKLNIGSVQLPFIANQGQIDESVEFYARTFAGSIFITKEAEIVYTFPKEKRKLYYQNKEHKDFKDAVGIAIKEQLEGARSNSILGEKPTPASINYFKGHLHSKWKNHIPAYQQIDLGEVYDGIHLKLKAFGNNIEKLFYVEPGANPDDIKINLQGANWLSVSQEGQLEVVTEIGTIKFSNPAAYQQSDSEKIYIDADYWVENNTYGFTLGDYDKSKELVIDPLIASTFLGGGSEDGYIYSYVNVDENGDIYVTGITSSLNFPVTPGVYDENFNGGESDVFVSKLSGDLRTLIASTFLGGSKEDYATSLIFDKNGDVLIAGSTGSTDFPTTDQAFDDSFNGIPGCLGFNRDVFVTKLSSDLSSLLSSTYLGGEHQDGGWNTFLNSDTLGNIYVGGATYSFDFPTTPDAYNRTINSVNDVFVAKFDNQLSNLLACTLIGSRGWDDCFAIKLDTLRNIYICGSAGGDDFPTTPGAFQENWVYYGDAYVSKFDNELTTLLASTYLGGGDTDCAFDLILGKDGEVYVTGKTESADFPITPDAYDVTFNGSMDVFISKLDPDLTTLQASTYLGGSGNEAFYNVGIAADKQENIYITGGTSSPDFPVTPGAYDQDYNGSGDVFITKLDNRLKSLSASTFLGSNDLEYANCILIHDDDILVEGHTYSFYFPTTPDAYDISYNSGGDIFVSIIDRDLSAPPIKISQSRDPGLPTGFALHPNYPNPFNPITTIEFDLPKDVQVRLTISDLSGKPVKVLVNEKKQPGHYSITWDGTDNNGNSVASGVYIYAIVAGEFTESKPCVLLR